MAPQSIQYRDSNGIPVTIELSLDNIQYNEGTSINIVYWETENQPPPTCQIQFFNVMVTKQGLENAIFNFAKDQLLLEDWRQHCNININEKQLLTANGFFVENKTLYYNRRIEAIAKESEIARWLILKRSYRKEDGILNIHELIKEETNHFPTHVLRKELETLKDLKFMTTIIEGIENRDNKLIRLTAQGKKYYEEHELPAHNIVFFIVPCFE